MTISSTLQPLGAVGQVHEHLGEMTGGVRRDGFLAHGVTGNPGQRCCSDNFAHWRCSCCGVSVVGLGLGLDRLQLACAATARVLQMLNQA